MSHTARRTIEELSVRYELEPSLHDIYVEGLFDREVIVRRLGESMRNIVTVYEIDTVDVPGSLLKQYNLTEGNKQRVIALSRALASVRGECNYRCVADKDMDHWFGPLEIVRGLIWTEHCALELYFFTDELISDLLIVAAKAKIDNVSVFVASLIEVLRHIFAMRLADRELELSMKWLAPDKQLKAVGSTIEFHREEYAKRLLISNGKHDVRAKFEESVIKWQSLLTGDHREFIRGHDFIEALVWAIKAFKGIKELATSVAVQRIFVLHANRIEGLIKSLALQVDGCS